MTATQNALNKPIIYNIGYQRHNQNTFVQVLLDNKITLLVDLREKPYSRIAGFNQRALTLRLTQDGIGYVWMGKQLGGLTCTRGQWEKGCIDLVDLAKKNRVAMMCMEADIEKCHREKLAEMLTFFHQIQNINL